MARTPFCSADGLKKGAWTAEEDQKLIAYIQKHGEGGWRSFPEKAGLKRCGKSCRLRWANYLRPGIKRGDFTSEEDQTIIELHAKLGNRWAVIARHLRKRTDNEIKNYWNAHLKKRLVNMGVDPVTHKPVVGCTTPGTGSSAGGNSDSTGANGDPKTHLESAKAQQSEPTSQQQPTSSRSSSNSASALLLNKLATRVTILQCVVPLRAWQTPMSFNGNDDDGDAHSIERTDKFCHPASSFQINNNTSTTIPETSGYWLELDNNITDPLLPTPSNCLDLSKAVLSPPESAEYGIAVDDGGIDHLPPKPAGRCFSSTTSVGVLNNMASKFASLRCIDELNDWQNNGINLPGQIQLDSDAITIDYGGLSGDINIDDDHMISDSVGSPGFCNSTLF